MEGGRLGLREGAGVGVVDGSDGVAGGGGRKASEDAISKRVIMIVLDKLKTLCGYCQNVGVEKIKNWNCTYFEP
jgi:hypothetical protein